MTDNPVAVSFHDALLHAADVQLLRGPFWLNDAVIAFYLEYVTHATFSTTSPDDNPFLFISPQVTQCVKLSPWHQAHIFLEPLQLQRRLFTFFAVNDCEATERPGGSHWSLLVYSKPDNAMCHFDSSSGSNWRQAGRLATNLCKYLATDVDLCEMDTLQQTNSYDCGVHLLCNVDHVAGHCARHNRVTGVGPVDQTLVDTKRAHVLHLIDSLSVKQAEA